MKSVCPVPRIRPKIARNSERPRDTVVHHPPYLGRMLRSQLGVLAMLTQFGFGGDQSASVLPGEVALTPALHTQLGISMPFSLDNLARTLWDGGWWHLEVATSGCRQIDKYTQVHACNGRLRIRFGLHVSVKGNYRTKYFRGTHRWAFLAPEEWTSAQHASQNRLLHSKHSFVACWA